MITIKQSLNVKHCILNKESIYCVHSTKTWRDQKAPLAQRLSPPKGSIDHCQCDFHFHSNGLSPTFQNVILWLIDSRFQLWNLPVTVLAVCKIYLLNKIYWRCKLKMKNCKGLRYIKPLCFCLWHLLYNIGDISRAFGRIWTSKNPIFDGVHFMTNLRILV